MISGIWLVPEAIPPGEAEALPLRWLRKAAEHPIRSSLALLLLLLALPGPASRASQGSRATPGAPGP